MSFRFNIDLSLSFPPPPPRHNQPNPLAPHLPRPKSTVKMVLSQRKASKAGYRPRASTRNTIFAYSVNNIWSYRVNDVASGAFVFLIGGLLWQLLNLEAVRLFHGRQIPNWLIAVVETVGFGGFLTMTVLEILAVDESTRYSYSPIGVMDAMMVAYDSGAWIVCCLLNAILAIQAYAQGGHGKGKGKDHAGGEEEEALLGEAENEAESEAGPSGEAPEASYRDEPESRDAA
ncbi:hypothetical protein G7Y79_00005g017440 [Physcia stellaris]|nr:hypothetical protein G7Y79_00005g017440 [Physcia stellaris]